MGNIYTVSLPHPITMGKDSNMKFQNPSTSNDSLFSSESTNRPEDQPSAPNNQTHAPAGDGDNAPEHPSDPMAGARDTDSSGEGDEFLDARECNYEQHSKYCGGCRCGGVTTIGREQQDQNFWQRLIALPVSIVKSILNFVKGIFRTTKDTDASGNATTSSDQPHEAFAGPKPEQHVQPIDESASIQSSSRPGTGKIGMSNQDEEVIGNGGFGQGLSAKELKKEKERRKRTKRKEKKKAKKSPEAKMKDAMECDGNDR